MKLYSPDEVAKKTGDTNPATLANWRSQGIGPPYVKIGGRVFYPEHLFDEWLESRINYAGLTERKFA